MRKRLTSVLLCFLMCVSLIPVSARAAEAAGADVPEIPTEGDVWDGSIMQPTKLVQKNGVYYYEITKCSELAYVAQTGGDWLGYNYILGNNLILNDVELTWDEDGELTNTEPLLEWTPIGGSTYDTRFSGVFDGAGYTISGLFLDRSGGNAGLFDYMFGSIYDLNILNAFVKSSGTKVGGFAADICGTGINIENCVFGGCVVSRNNGITATVGGFAGQVESGNFKDCLSIATIISNGTRYSGGFSGGFGGKAIGCSAYGEVVSGEECSGGFAGYASNAKLEKCMAINNVSGLTNVGGFLGTASYTKISSCYSSGNVLSSNGMAGGFLAISYNNGVEIENCYCIGNVQGASFAGGFCGQANGDMETSYSLADVQTGEQRGAFVGDDRRVWGASFDVENNYYLRTDNINASLHATAYALSDVPGEIEGRSADSLKIRTNYENWDFDTVWSISPDVNGGYPYLQWQEGMLSEIAASSVQISETALTLSVGDYAYLSATVSPVNASNKAVTWSSSEPDIAAVSAAGKVTAVSAGTATITVTAEDGGYTAACTVTVTERLAEEYRINGITVRDNEGKVLSEIPVGSCLATISVSNVASDGNTLVFLAAYTSTGQYHGLMWVSVEDLPAGATIKVTLPVDNSDGKIANLKAFTVASLFNPSPLGETVSFLP